MAKSVVEGQEAPGRAAVHGAEARVGEMRVEVKKVVATNDGRLQVQLESEAMSAEMVAQAQGLLGIQQGPVMAAFEPVRQELDA